MGWKINEEKSELTPSPSFTFVGVRYNLQLGLMYPPEERYQTAVRKIQEILNSPQSTLRAWQSILGLLQSMADQVGLGRLHTRPLHISLRSQVSLRDRPETPVRLTKNAAHHLSWWLQEQQVMQGLNMKCPPPTAVMTSDSSGHAWGAHLSFVNSTAKIRQCQGRWNEQETTLHNNAKELLAVHRALKEWESVLSGQSVRIETDNQTTVSLINCQGTVRSRSLHNMTTDLLTFCLSRQVHIRAFHLPGILNVLADKLSRPNKIHPTEWSLNQRVADQLFSQLGRPHIDLFATNENWKLQTYVSPYRDPQAYAVDALSLDWRGMYAYAFPPPKNYWYKLCRK